MNATYYENGWEARVQIIDDTSDEEFERLKLRVLSTNEESPYVETPPDGHVFDVEQRLDNYGDAYEVIKDA